MNEKQNIANFLLQERERFNQIPFIKFYGMDGVIQLLENQLKKQEPLLKINLASFMTMMHLDLIDLFVVRRYLEKYVYDDYRKTVNQREAIEQLVEIFQINYETILVDVSDYWKRRIKNKTQNLNLETVVSNPDSLKNIISSGDAYTFINYGLIDFEKMKQYVIAWETAKQLKENENEIYNLSNAIYFVSVLRGRRDFTIRKYYKDYEKRINMIDDIMAFYRITGRTI